ncbi:MAG TPA: response regulator, partial [Ramlibacter sp.]|nr:response regulator [Ramlibacter sp.]
ERENRRRQGNEPVLTSDLYLPPAGLGPHSFAIQVPVRRDGQVRGFLTLASYARQLQRVFEEQRLPSDWNASVVDGAGVVVARSRDADKVVGTSIRPAFLQHLRATAEGTWSGTNLTGVPATSFFSRVPRAGWHLVVSVPDAAIRSTGLRAAALMGAISLLLLGLAVAAAVSVARRTARPMEALRQAAERLGRNEPVQPQATGVLEVDAVQDAMVQASERLRRANAELEHKVAEAVANYRGSQRALLQAQKLEALGRLTGGIAHDFNNVLQTLTTGLQAARMDAPEKVRLLLSTCERAVARGSELARQLMVFGRVQEARVETIELRRRLAEARPLLAGALPSDIQFHLELAPELWPVTLDPLQLELALLNLVMNARDAMPGGGQLQVRAVNEAQPRPGLQLPEGGYVAISVHDGGEGMTEEVLARAVDPFFTTKGVGRGSGMGLAQVYGFARQSGGALLLESRPGQGTTATLLLPRTSRAVPAAAGPDATMPGVSGHGTVLLVEDDALVRDTVRTGLQMSGFRVRTAQDADEALAQLDAGELPDVVFTDVVMPGSMSGIDLARQVGRRWPGVRVLIATGYSDRAIDVPGVRTLAKPYELRQAVAALNDALAAVPAK